MIPFPVKALKIIINDLQSDGEAATLSAAGGAFEVDSDDGVCLLLDNWFGRI